MKIAFSNSYLHPTKVCLTLLMMLPLGVGAVLAQRGTSAHSSDTAQPLSGRELTTVSGTEGSLTPTEVDEHTASEVHCLALNIYFEARSESEMGQRAVGHVVMNRVAHRSYPASVCDVVRQGGEQQLHRCQFSWWCDGQSDKPKNAQAWGLAMELARGIYGGMLPDVTNGALWYHATYVTPYWSKVLLQGDKIGQHIFYLEHSRAENTL